MDTGFRHSLLLLVGLSCAIVRSAPLHAQNAQVPRPDSIGANFDISSPGKGTLNDYDFLVGSWKFVYQQRDLVSGNYRPPVNGEWTARKAFETLIADEFVLQPGPTPGPPIFTFRVFNPTRKLWEIQGVAARRGVWQPGESWSDGADLYVVQDNPETKTTVRIRYYSITPTRFLWRADGSRDGGKTWVRDIMLIEATRVR
jgi:hypothetical protein